MLGFIALCDRLQLLIALKEKPQGLFPLLKTLFFRSNHTLNRKN